MGKQLAFFTGPELDANDRLNAAQAEMRLQQAARGASKPARHHRSVAGTCPSCGACVTIRVS